MLQLHNCGNSGCHGACHKALGAVLHLGGQQHVNVVVVVVVVLKHSRVYGVGRVVERHVGHHGRHIEFAVLL